MIQRKVFETRSFNYVLLHKKDTKREVFGQMFTELYPRLVRYATQLLGDGEEARDIVGSVMEQAWKQFEKLEPENRGAWLYTAARNACLNRLKHFWKQYNYRVFQYSVCIIRDIPD